MLTLASSTGGQCHALMRFLRTPTAVAMYICYKRLPLGYVLSYTGWSFWG